MTISATCTWRARRLVEGRGDDLALDRALHVGDLLRALVDQQHDQTSSGWLVVMAFAIFCRNTVLPARGGETIRQR
jgi:hypothetical protein